MMEAPDIVETAKPDESSDGVPVPSPDSGSVPAPDVPKGRVERIVSTAKSLAVDLMEIVDLKMQLVQVQIEEHIEQRVNRAIQRLLVLAAAALSGVFVLVALAFALGTWLGNPAWGFLAVGLVVGLGAWVLARVRPKMIDLGNDEGSETPLLPEEGVAS